MPLCPQITNTPITVTQTADFTVTSVVPLVADTSDGLANNLESIEILADGKTKVYRQAAAPTGAGINDGDLWIDTDDGNKLYVRVSGAWVSAQDASIGVAQTTANNAATAAGAAQSTANTALADAATAYATGVAAQNTANSASSAAATANAVGVAAQNTANTALANAATANSAAQAAQADATTAIANAATAYNTAVAANTAAGVAQATANGKNKVTYSTSAPGSTANTVGDIWYQYGTTAPNVGRIIAQYMGAGGTSWTQTTVSGLVIANIDAGNITTGTLTAAVGISNPSGNFSVNGATGALVATGATITGNITATSGTFTGTIISSNATITGGTLTVGSKFSVDGTGTLNATGATITGTLTSNAVTITGGTLTIGTKFSVTNTGILTATDGVFTGTITSSNATITGGTLTVGANFSVGSTGVLVATGATITGTLNATAGYFGSVSDGWSISSTGLTGVGTGAITGGTIQTSSGSAAVIMNGAANALQFKVSGSISGNVLPLGSAGILMHYGSTPDGTGATYPKAQVTSSSATIAGSTSQSMSAGAGGNTIVGQTQVTDAMTFSSTIFANGNIDGGVNCEIYAFRGATNTTTGNAANAWLNSTTGRLARSTSSLRYKTDVQPQSIPFDSILQLEPKSFYDKREYEENPETAKRILGLIAEEVAEIPVLKDLLVNYDAEGNADAISYPTIAVAILPLLKDFNARIQALEQGK